MHILADVHLLTILVKVYLIVIAAVAGSSMRAAWLASRPADFLVAILMVFFMNVRTFRMCVCVYTHMAHAYTYSNVYEGRLVGVPTCSFLSCNSYGLFYECKNLPHVYIYTHGTCICIFKCI
jgi:hypothetical protein